MINGKEMLIHMGFEHEQFTANYSHEPLKIVTTHILTHPLIPGLFATGHTLEDAARKAMICTKVLMEAYKRGTK